MEALLRILNLTIHNNFSALVQLHVLQWQALGSAPFIQRYMSEVIKYGYRQAPLEEKAYGFEDRFVADPKSPLLIAPSDTV